MSQTRVPQRSSKMPTIPKTSDDDSYIYNTRPPSSARRWNTGQDTQAYQQGNKQIIVHQGLPKRQFHPRVYLIGGAIAAILVIWLGGMIVSWWNGVKADLAYGNPRTWQTNEVVGHNGDSSAHPTHFIFLNLDGDVDIIEIPAGAASKAVIYAGPTLVGGNVNAPITASFVNDNGREDMIVYADGQQIATFLNDGTQFKEQQ